MNTNVLRMIESSKVKVIIFDIDGTLKDLCKEHSIALSYALNECNVSSMRKNVVMLVNRIAMLMIKMGIFSTNNFKQRFLLKVFAILSGVKVKTFSNAYLKKYTEQICLFEGVFDILSYLKREREIYFSTINKQNYNLEECGIPQERIVYTEGKFKVTTYKKILKSIGVDKKEIIIVGDNIIDDILAAKFLGLKSLLVNHYNSKIKSVFCKIVNSKYLK